MLRKLHVRNYVLIDTLDIEFANGLIIVTGQTGAGKSIMIGALSTVLGAKADASIIGASADNCVIEAEFDMNPDDLDLQELLEDCDAEWDDGHLLIRRVINKSGRSRVFLNDSPVTLANLSTIASRLLDIHSQHQTLLLSDKRFQLSVLDRYAGNANLLKEYSDEWNHYNSLVSEVSALKRKIAEAEAEREYIDTQYRQLEEAHLRDGEMEELEEEQKRLANAEEIKSCLCGAESLFSGEAFNDEGVSVTSVIREIQKNLARVEKYVPKSGELSQRLESVRLELEDISSDISDLSAITEVSPERLQVVDDRISLLHGLMHRHSCNSLAELISVRDSLSNSISGSQADRDELICKTNEMELSRNRVDQLAAKLHESRVSAAPAFANAIQEKLHFLELPYAIFLVDVLSSELSSSGMDSVMFRFSSSGKDAVDVSKCASGGEMSRIMLSLKALMSRYFNMPTMIFDEIDTGVSGSVADKMGTMICDMGNYMQVFAITHLPQVAAKGHSHYLVSKSIDPQTSSAETTIKRLSDEQRVLEVARMLSGSSLTDAAIENAKALLQS